jgi:hypothetical protein
MKEERVAELAERWHTNSPDIYREPNMTNVDFSGSLE